MQISEYFGTILFMTLEQPPFSVSELTLRIKSSLEQQFPRVRVQGELSNVKFHSSGHLYFTLKDESAQLSAAMWRSRAGTLTFRPEDGMKVIARGPIKLYAPRGSYQIEVEHLQPVGVGELQMAFEHLKRRLAEEGLFDRARKRPLPLYPESIGIVTSETGAALQDIRSVLGRRMPNVELVLVPVRVQGPGAADEIARGIRELNAFGSVDVMIVGRGGGSLEDLWPFNEEIVARAIAVSKIPVISAVGHEIDFCIADFVADLRAATPSAAAELVVRDRGELLESLRNISYTMNELLTDRVKSMREYFRSMIRSYAFHRPLDLLRESSQRLDELDRNLTNACTNALESAQQRHSVTGGSLEALGPRNVLRRGYAIIRKEGRVVTRAAVLHPGDAAKIEFADGTAEATIQSQSTL
jgi:exodeoxyribonuclease VII large subunit